MKILISLLFSLFLALPVISQNGIYLFGFMENAPATPVDVEVIIFADSTQTFETLTTTPSGIIETVFVALPDGATFDALFSSFIDCDGNDVFDYTDAADFPNLVDIPLLLQYCADSLVYGCTDPAAINYDPYADIDDGSCSYPSNCDLNEVVINMTTASWGYEISWTLGSDSAEVASGSGYASNATYSTTYCLPDGCYDLIMADSYGDGWNGGTIDILVNGTLVNTSTLDDGFIGSSTFGINQDSCDVTVLGCTDPEAENYNPEATIDDGSCSYPPATPNDLCADATPILPGIITVDNSEAVINEGIWGECWGFGSGEGEQTSVWYSFTTPYEPASITIEALYDGTNTLTDTQFGLFETCGGEMIHCDGNSGEGLMSAFNFACGELEENTTYILMIDGWNGDAGTCLLSFEVDTLCGSTILGCTDPEALNYDPTATEDDGTCIYDSDCDDNLITVEINTVIWANEISWNIVDANQNEVAGGGTYANNSTYTSDWCLPNGCYSFELFDSFGDGWNGGTYTIWLDSAIISSGTLDTGNYGTVNFGINSTDCDSTITVFGCTDPEALNFNPLATADDGSCVYDSDCDGFEGIFGLNSNYEYSGWWEILNTETGEYVIGDTIPADVQYNSDFCLQDGCYNIQLNLFSDSAYNASVYVVVGDETIFAEFLVAGEYNTDFQVGAGCDSLDLVYGCTDPEAVNYNPLANTDDGSCAYGFDCSVDFLVVPDSTGEDVIWIIPSANIFTATSVLWDFGDGTTSTELFPQHEYVGDGPFTLCLTAFFESATGSTCSITFCAVLTGDMVGSGFAAGNGFAINVISEQAPLSASQGDEGINFTLWPNPTSGVLNIALPDFHHNEIKADVMDITGKILIEKTIHKAENASSLSFEAGELPDGIYLLRITSLGETHTKRFVIAK